MSLLSPARPALDPASNRVSNRVSNRAAHRAETAVRSSWSGPSRPALGRTIRGVVTWGAALAALVCLIATALALAVGGRVLVVQTGSMEPGLPVGTVMIVRPAAADQVRPGQVLGVLHGDGRLVTHRLVSTAPAAGDGVRRLVLKGDANRAADEPVVTDEVMVPVVTVPVSLASLPMRAVHWPWFQYWMGVMTVIGAWSLARRNS